jgi:predicted nucleotidyltransferase component of viral defense system
MQVPDYKTARKYPPANAHAYTQATAAELLAVAHGLDAEDLYDCFRLENVDIHGRFAVLEKNRRMCVELLHGKA